MNCQDCKFWVRDFEHESIGECRRRPPAYVNDRDSFVRSRRSEAAVFPPTAYGDWCGEHEPHDVLPRSEAQDLAAELLDMSRDASANARWALLKLILSLGPR